MPFPNPFDLKHHRFGSGGDLVEQFLATYPKRGTRRSYRSDLQQFFGEDEVSPQKASRTQKEDITAFLKQRVEDALKRSTLNRKLETIRSFFRWLAAQNMIEEPPIREEEETGDLVDQALEEAHKTTEGEGDSPTAEEPDGKGKDDSEGSRRGPVQMELEPGSEVNLGRKTDSSYGESSSPGSRPEVGPSAEATPGTEHSDGEDRPSIPDWAVPSGNAQEINLDHGEHVALANLPDALVGALPELEEHGGPEGLFIRCTNDLKVAVRPRRDEDSQIIEISVEHYVLQRLLRGEEDLSDERVLRQAIIYLHDLNWTLPPPAYDLVDALPSLGDAEGPLSQERPRWRLEDSGGGLGHPVLAALITGVLAEGFGIEKDEEVFVAA